MDGFLTPLTGQQVQTNIDQTIDFVKTGKPLSITQDGQAEAMLFSFKEGSELIRLRDIARLNGYLAARQDSIPQDAPELSMDDINKLIGELRQ